MSPLLPAPGQPTPAVALDAEAGPYRSHFGREVELPGGFTGRLRAVCDDVDDSDQAVTEAGRDWWPLTVGWALHGEVPARAGVVCRPRVAEEVAGILARCHEERVPVTPAAGRSGVCGASVPIFGGVSLDLTGLSGIVDVDDTSLTVDVGAGTFGDRFEDRLREGYGLTLGHWPQSMALSTVGGWLACRSAGQYSTRYGKIEDMVRGLDVVLADGRAIRTGDRGPRAAAGPDLDQLFVGSEGTLGVITAARLQVRPIPPTERRAAFAFESMAAGLDACRRILRRGATPAVLRLYDPRESQRSFDVDDAAVLLVLDEADEALADAVLSVVREECSVAQPLDEVLVGRWLAHRNQVASLGDLAMAGIVADTIEIAARWAVLPDIYDQALAALSHLDGGLGASAHQSHAYPDGACLYFTFAGRLPDPHSAERFYRQAWDAVMAITLAHGGTPSHHHGIGLNRARHLAPALGPAHQVLVGIKAALDPGGILNPGKLGLGSPFGPVPWP